MQLFTTITSHTRSVYTPSQISEKKVCNEKKPHTAPKKSIDFAHYPRNNRRGVRHTILCCLLLMALYWCQRQCVWRLSAVVCSVLERRIGVLTSHILRDVCFWLTPFWLYLVLVFEPLHALKGDNKLLHDVEFDRLYLLVVKTVIAATGPPVGGGEGR